MFLITFLKKFDDFGHRVCLHYGNLEKDKENKLESLYKTLPGSIFSITIRGAFTFFIYYFLK